MGLGYWVINGVHEKQSTLKTGFGFVILTGSLHQFAQQNKKYKQWMSKASQPASTSTNTIFLFTTIYCVQLDNGIKGCTMSLVSHNCTDKICMIDGTMEN